MGQPSAPQIYQQPSQQELAANAASNQQKAAALVKLNQSLFAESRGLRGMGGLYDWAGPTPDLAPNMIPGAAKPKGKGDSDTGPGEGPTTVPFDAPPPWSVPVAVPDTGRGAPKNTGAVPNANPPTPPLIGRGAPANTGQVPPTVTSTVPASAFTNLGLKPPEDLPPAPVAQGAPANTGQVPATALAPTAPNFQTQAQKTLGIAPVAPKPAAPLLNFQQLTAAKFGIKPTSLYGTTLTSAGGGRR
jgi:hypothetical protein